MKYQLTWIAITFLTLQQTANARTDLCGEDAPLLDSGFYYEINDPQEIPEKQLGLLRQIAKSLDGKWRGEETVALCEGHFSNPKAAKYEYTIDAEISTSSSGMVRLRAEKELSDRSVSKLQTLWLTPETDTPNDSQRWHTLEFINPNTLIYSHKYRARNGQRAKNGQRTVRLIHEVNKVRVRGTQLLIDRKLYVNGTIVEQSGFSLRKAS